MKTKLMDAGKKAKNTTSKQHHLFRLKADNY